MRVDAAVVAAEARVRRVDGGVAGEVLVGAGAAVEHGDTGLGAHQDALARVHAGDVGRDGHGRVELQRRQRPRPLPQVHRVQPVLHDVDEAQRLRRPLVVRALAQPARQLHVRLRHRPGLHRGRVGACVGSCGRGALEAKLVLGRGEVRSGVGTDGRRVARRIVADCVFLLVAEAGVGVPETASMTTGVGLYPHVNSVLGWNGGWSRRGAGTGGEMGFRWISGPWPCPAEVDAGFRNRQPVRATQPTAVRPECR